MHCKKRCDQNHKNLIQAICLLFVLNGIVIVYQSLQSWWFTRSHHCVYRGYVGIEIQYLTEYN